MTKPSQPMANIHDNPLAEVVLTGSLLGLICGLSVALIPYVRFKGLNLYLAALTAFHFLEYFVTAKHNTEKVSVDSYLLFSNGMAYIGAHGCALTEAMIEHYLFPHFKTAYPYVSAGGFALVLGGQALRYRAMATAGRSFNHHVAEVRREGHTLVTTGVYLVSRHPSYAGFYWWALGTQILLLNPVCLAGFAIVLWRFFDRRIKVEERYLVEFFGKPYEEFRRRTGVFIPGL